MNYHEEKIAYHQEKIAYHQRKMEQEEQEQEEIKYKCYVGQQIGELLTEMHGNDPCWLSEKIDRIKKFKNDSLAWEFIAYGLDYEHQEKYGNLHGVSLEELQQFFKILRKLT